MKEPYEVKSIHSLIEEDFAGEDNDISSEIPTISPARTFLEKAFLLNEEYRRSNPRTLRMSRHLYDLERLMNSGYDKIALENTTMYREIVEHRRKFYRVSGIDYDTDMPEHIIFCPEGNLRNEMAEDYERMKSSFIYGNPLEFNDLIDRLMELQNRFRGHQS